jgi:SpoVK/Ycf46/Vps4 family AAA+-type ATPase
MDELSKPTDGSPVKVVNYGSIANNKLAMGGVFRNDTGWFYNVVWNSMPDNPVVMQTCIYYDRYDKLNCDFVITVEKEISVNKLEDIVNDFKKYAFNHSRFKGKCIEVEIREGAFLGINIVELGDVNNKLILTETQETFMNHFVKRIARGKSMRVMLNGTPGCGKTETIRNIISRLTPTATFVIPKFRTISDLTTILTSCEIFDSGVIIMDDIDLFIGSRTIGGPTNLLGEFLNFFDGVQKRRISMLASTNDKKLVDEAAERPGRFNFVVDYDYLTKEQVIEISKIHFDSDLLVKEVMDLLTGNIDGKQVKLTGAFIANLSDNIKEMMLDYEEDNQTWTSSDTVKMIKSSYKGFYTSQIGREENTLGFKRDNKTKP